MANIAEVSKSVREAIIAAPVGTGGIIMEVGGDVYGVAANWSQASDYVLSYHGNGWSATQYQVADFRHSDAGAMRTVNEECYDEDGEPIEPEIDWSSSDAKHSDIIKVLENHGDTFAGNDVLTTAEEWAESGFSAKQVDDWCLSGVWSPNVARALQDANIEPQQAEAIAKTMKDNCNNPYDVYIDGCPIYAACNGDIDVQVIIDAAE